MAGRASAKKMKLAGLDLILFSVQDDGGYPLFEGFDTKGDLASLGAVWARAALPKTI